MIFEKQCAINFGKRNCKLNLKYTNNKTIIFASDNQESIYVIGDSIIRYDLIKQIDQQTNKEKWQLVTNNNNTFSVDNPSSSTSLIFVPK